jgi:hypothetical protein
MQNLTLTKGIRAMIYDFLSLRELLLITALSKEEQNLILKLTHKDGLIEAKPLTIKLSQLRNAKELRTALKLCSQVTFQFDKGGAVLPYLQALKHFPDKPIPVCVKIPFATVKGMLMSDKVHDFIDSLSAINKICVRYNTIQKSTDAQNSFIFNQHFFKFMPELEALEMECHNSFAWGAHY